MTSMRSLFQLVLFSFAIAVLAPAQAALLMTVTVDSKYVAQSFDTQRAWRCWDIGRRLSPQFPTLVAVTQYEQSLVTQFPEYF